MSLNPDAGGVGEPVVPSGDGWVLPLFRRVRLAYDAVPGLCLTPGELNRLCGVDPDAVAMVTAALVDVGCLRPTLEGYVRG